MGFRIDRFLTLYFLGPLLRRSIIKKRSAIPILMYHSISEHKEAVHPYMQICASPQVFESHVRYLHENHYVVLGLDKAIEQLAYGSVVNQKTVAITFDDGYQDFYTNAAPILKKYGFTATVFLPAAFITQTGACFNGKRCLSWRQVEELMTDGFSFGSHTLTHPELFKLAPAAIEHELVQSKRRIETQTRSEITSFAYPYAFPDHDGEFTLLMQRLLKKAGYKSGVTTRLGTAGKNDLPFIIKRIPVNGQDDLKLLGAKLRGEYDWLYLPQVNYKRIKRLKLRVN